MRKARFTEEQIIGILKEHDAGAKAEDLCRRHGISGTTFYKWKAKFGGMEASDAKRLRALEDENRRLKKLLAEQMLDNAALQRAGPLRYVGPPRPGPLLNRPARGKMRTDSTYDWREIGEQVTSYQYWVLQFSSELGLCCCSVWLRQSRQ
jgi:putative transposase